MNASDAMKPFEPSVTKPILDQSDLLTADEVVSCLLNGTTLTELIEELERRSPAQ